MKKVLRNAIATLCASTVLLSTADISTFAEGNKNELPKGKTAITLPENIKKIVAKDSYTIPLPKNAIFVTANGVPLPSQKVTKEGDNLIHIAYKEGKKVKEDRYIVNIKKTLPNRYVGEKYGIVLGKEIEIPLTSLFRFPKDDESELKHVELAFDKNPHVTASVVDDTIVIKGIKETTKDELIITPTYKSTKGKPFGINLSVFSNPPEVELVNLTAEKEYALLTSKEDYSYIDTVLVQEKQPISFNLSLYDADGGDISIQLLNGEKVVHKESVKNVSASDKTPTLHTVSFTPSTDMMNLKIVVEDSTGNTNFVPKVPKIVLASEQVYAQIMDSLTLVREANSDVPKKDIAYVSIDTLRDIHQDINVLKRGKSLSIDLLEQSIKGNTKGIPELRKKLLKEFRDNIDLWITKTNELVFIDEYKFLQLPTPTEENYFTVDFMRSKHIKSAKDTVIKKDIERIVAIENMLSRLEQNYDQYLYNTVVLYVNKLTDSDTKKHYIERLFDIDLDYKLGNTFMLQEDTLMYFVEEFGIDTPYKKGYLDSYILSINKQIELNKDKNISPKIILMSGMEDTYFYLKELENRKKKVKKGEKFTINDYKQFKKDMLDSNMAVTPLSYRHGITRYEKGAKINLATLETDVQNYYNKNYQRTYEKYLSQIKTKVTYKQLLNMVDLLNQYELAKKSTDAKYKKEVSKLLFKYFPNPKVKYQLIDMLQKEEWNSASYDFTKLGIVVADDVNKTHYTNVLTLAKENNIALTTENIYFTLLLVNEQAQTIQKYMKYPNKEEMTKEFEENYKYVSTYFPLSADKHILHTLIVEYMEKKHEKSL